MIDDEARGALLLKDGKFRPDRREDASVTMNQLLSLAKDAQNALTFTCTPPGSGERMGIDRNLDSVLDGD